MTKQPSRDRRLVEAIEVCRPSSDDLWDPALGELVQRLEANSDWEDLYERLQKLDSIISAAVQDVAVPRGLENRLRATLGDSADAPARSAAGTDSVSRLASELASVPARRHARRRRFWWPSLIGSVVAAGLLAAVLVHHQSTPYSSGTVLERAVELFNHDLRQTELPWQECSPPRGFPSSTAVRLFAQARWRPIEGLLEARGLAYQVRLNDVTAVLYVMNRPVDGLPSEPSPRPARSTANCSASVWQEHGLMYVLVVQGDWRAYELFLDLPRGPIA